MNSAKKKREKQISIWAPLSCYFFEWPGNFITNVVIRVKRWNNIDRKVEKQRKEKEAKESINKNVVLAIGNPIYSPEAYWSCVSA